MKKTLASASLALLALTGCSQQAETNTLVVGTNASFPPFEYIGGQSGTEVIGFDIDLVKQIAADSGKTLVIEDMKFDSLIVALNSGKIDMIASGMTITEERQKNVNFSDPYYEATQLVITQQDITFTDSSELKGKKIAVQLGTTGDAMAKAFSDQIVAFNTGFEAIMELNNGRVDAVLFDAAPALNLIANRPALKATAMEFEPEFYGFAVNKNNPELLEQINATLATMKANGSYDALISKHMQ
ncbi:MAG: basic amino acid ABC transporter substrate-binding protein [Ferrimonas sp.]